MSLLYMLSMSFVFFGGLLCVIGKGLEPYGMIMLFLGLIGTAIWIYFLSKKVKGE